MGCAAPLEAVAGLPVIDPTALVAADGSVLVPATLVGAVRRALMRDTAAQLGANGGGRQPLEVAALLVAFDAALRPAEERIAADRPGCPDIGTAGSDSATLGVSASQAAQRLGCDPSWVRRLARAGRIRGRLSGSIWVVDPSSLTEYLQERDERHRPGADAGRSPG